MEHQLSMFDTEPLTEFQEALLHGSGFAGGKYRIYAAAIQLSDKELALFLKNEYGLGGFSFNEGFVDYDARGICIWKFRSDARSNYTWAETANEIKHLIAIDAYLTDKEKETIKSIQNKHKELPTPSARMVYA